MSLYRYSAIIEKQRNLWSNHEHWRNHSERHFKCATIHPKGNGRVALMNMCWRLEFCTARHFLSTSVMIPVRRQHQHNHSDAHLDPDRYRKAVYCSWLTDARTGAQSRRWRVRGANQPIKRPVTVPISGPPTSTSHPPCLFHTHTHTVTQHLFTQHMKSSCKIRVRQRCSMFGLNKVLKSGFKLFFLLNKMCSLIIEQIGMITKRS